MMAIMRITRVVIFYYTSDVHNPRKKGKKREKKGHVLIEIFFFGGQ